MTAQKDKTTHRFQAEVTQVLSLVIHSLYSNPDVFLRELVSNASDALDKLRFRAVTEPTLLPEGDVLKIRILPDAEAKTLTIWDNGVGMGAEDLARELGTVAHSGTRAFIEKIEQAKKNDLSLIGQFGVGFYSAYLAADRVEVTSRAAGSTEAYRWSSEGAETFTIEPAERESQGTTVLLHLKADSPYSSPYKLRELVRKYSDYLDYPIELVTQEKDKDDKEGGKTTEKVETLNKGKALWQQKPADITKEQYEEFYKHLTHDFDAPALHRHFQIEGTQVFTGLLFVPKRPPFDLFSPDSHHGVRLYVRRVFIMDDCEELLPRWLRFVRGVVDSEDLPLNVSREMLQDSARVRVIRKQVQKQILDGLDDLAKEEAAQYTEFWNTFGKVLKEGLHFDPEQKDRLLPLLRYESSRGEGLVSLADYKARMKEGQKAIYYVIAESPKLAETSPHTETLRQKGYEVLYMTDAVDSFAVDALTEFDGVPLTSATGAELELDEVEKVKKGEAENELKSLCDHVRRQLQDQISEVRVSTRLTGSPACLVIPEGGLQPYVERLLRASQSKGQPPRSKRILELNPGHSVVRNLAAMEKKDASSEKLKNYVEVLFDQALLAEGSPIEDPGRFATQLTSLLEEVSSGAIASGAA